MRTLRLLLAWTVMLALVGGLGGTVLAQDDATEQSLGDPLPGVELVTEQVEPGVYRVVNDGVRELSNPLGLDDFFARCCWEPPGDVYRHSAFEANDIVASEAGVWLRDPEGIIRLGKAEPVWAPDDGDGTPEFKAAPDGTLYQPRSRRVLEGDDWVEMKLRLGKYGLREIEEIMFAHDGSLWVLGDTGKGGGRAPTAAGAPRCRGLVPNQSAATAAGVAAEPARAGTRGPLHESRANEWPAQYHTHDRRLGRHTRRQPLRQAPQVAPALRWHRLGVPRATRSGSRPPRRPRRRRVGELASPRCRVA